MSVWEGAKSAADASTCSAETFGVKHDGWVSTGTWSPETFHTLSSPPPVCSPVYLGSSSVTSKHHLFQVPIESSPQTNQWFSVLSDEDQKPPSKEETESVNNYRLPSKVGEHAKQECCPRNKPNQKAKSVRTYRRLILCEPSTISVSASSEPINCSTHQEMHRVSSNQPINYSTYQSQHSNKERKENQGHKNSIGEAPSVSNLSLDISVITCGASNVDRLNGNHGPTAELGKRHFHEFISGIKRNKIEAKLDEWKTAKSNKLMDKLRRKEALINLWEIKKTARVGMEMTEVEAKLEKKRLKALEKMQKEIKSIQRKANEEKVKQQQATARKISDVSKMAEKKRETGKLQRLKALIHW